MRVSTSRAAASPAMAAAITSQIRLPNTVVFATAKGEFRKNSEYSTSEREPSLVIRKVSTSSTMTKSQGQGRPTW
ncbi:hypothetical protein [Pontibacter pamirensis]|uniref:hypothetical protein n=1 Tax=Pontibacter pamirensis TaxID=2562824 RepID=UPI001F30968E|nr:hypothetical protein [Pontibacter pamirensis]